MQKPMKIKKPAASPMTLSAIALMKRMANPMKGKDMNHRFNT